MADYISTDPNAGVEQKQYLSTDPNFGLEQSPSVGEIAQHAGTAAVETAKGFIPKSLGEVLGFVTPVVGAVQDVGRGYGMLKDVLFGKPISEATAQNFPETQILPQAEKTAPYSEERFQAGFGALAQLGMAAIGGRGLAKTTEALPQIPETPISDAVQPPTGGIENAQQIISPTQVHGDVQYAPRPQESVGEVPANVGSEGVQARGQGEVVQGQEGQVTLYHSTPKKFDAFTGTGTPTGLGGKAFYFSDKPEPAYGENVVPISIPKDKILDLSQPNIPYKNDAEIRKAGYEGTFNRETGEFTVYDPNKFIQQTKALAPVPEKMVNAVRTPTGKITGYNVEHGDAISLLSEQHDPADIESGWVLPGKTKKQTDATFINTKDVQKFNGDFQAAFDEKAQQTPQEVAPTVPQPEQPTGASPTTSEIQSTPIEPKLPQSESPWRSTLWDELNPEQRKFAEDKYARETGDEPRFAKTADWYVNKETGEVSPSTQEIFESTRKSAPVSESTEATTAQPLTQDLVVETPPTVSETTPKGQAEPIPESQSITSIKNEQVDTERSNRGLPPVIEPARKAFGETWEQATKKIDNDPGYPDRLIEELKAKPRALNDVEDAALLHRQVDLQNQFRKSTDDLFRSRETGDAVGAMEHDARVNALSDQLLELYDVGKKAGTETGRGLAARQLLAAEDFSLANMVTQKRAANPTIDVETATKSAQEASDKISAAQSALDQHETSPKAEAYKKRLKTLTEQYRTKTEQGDFSKRVPVKIPLDKEGQALKADLERAKKEWLTALQKDRAANRTPSQKFWDRFVGVERAMKLSSDVVLAKLSAAALVREAGLTPAEEVVGAGIGKILPGLAKRAPREGGFSPAAEIKAKSEMFTSGMKDAWQNLKMKQTDLDTLYSGRKPPPPSEFYDYLGYLHGALKAPIKRAEFARSLTKRMKWTVENGQDLNNVNTMRELSEEAYTDANRSIFMQDNVVASTFTGALRMAEMSKKAPNLGPAVARIGRFLVPIVKIPTNIVGEVATGVHGVATGGSRAAVAYLKGIDSLPPVQADSIMRQLKKGAIGNALILTGYYTANNIGGFYHDQDKRTPEDVQPGRYRIGSVDIPASAGHSTGAMLLNIGATVKRVQDERIKKSESTTKGLGEGIRAAGAGLAHEIPFVPAATGITDALGTKGGFEKYVNGMIQSTTVPALSSHIAKILDTPGSLPSNILQEPVKRKPTGPVEAVKMGIPGLRQTVPERTEKVSKNRPR